MKNAKADSSIKTIAVNRKARHDYHLGERYEAGIALQGTEVKSIRAGLMNLTDSYARVQDSEVFLIDAYINPYEHGNRENHEPKRPRKLLLRRQEIKKIEAKIRPSGMTLVPTKAYFSNGRVKLEIALARGKHEYDRREDLQKEADERAIRSYLKERNR
ncbi:SsrA-binding protein SmpB [Candidatus Poribacteria bacterium]|nr:SsrA-binding protein SmpB [Candidatus Poribacteria bacterium]